MSESNVKVTSHYPYKSGDVTVIGPECFTNDEGVISYKGINYYSTPGICLERNCSLRDQGKMS